MKTDISGKFLLSYREKIAAGVLIGFSGLLFLLYLIGVLSNGGAYFVIVASFLFSFYIIIFEKRRSLPEALLTAGLFLTCTADIFLGFLQHKPYCKEIGVTIFTLVQALYALRIAARGNGGGKTFTKRVKACLSIRLMAVAAGILLTLVFFYQLPVFRLHGYLLIITSVYIATAAVNAVYAGLDARYNPLIPAGLILLLICDIFLGAAFLGARFDGGYFAPSVSAHWIFYLPSQPVLALSALTETDRPRDGQLAPRRTVFMRLSKTAAETNEKILCKRL